MGITHHLFHVMLREHRLRPITGEFLFIGRQSVLMSPEAALSVLRRSGHAPRPGSMPDIDRDTLFGRANGGIQDRSLLALFSDARPHALDLTDGEGADIVQNLHDPLDPSLHHRFDFILNGSCLDNVFDPVSALENMTRMLKPGGRILHWESVSSNPYQPYVMPTVNWLTDYYVANRFHGVSAYVARCEDVFGAWEMHHWSPLDRALLRFGMVGMVDGRVDAGGILLACVIAESGPLSTCGRRPIQGIYRSDSDAAEMEDCLMALDPGRPVFRFENEGTAPAGGRLGPGFEPVGSIPAIDWWLEPERACQRLAAWRERILCHPDLVPAGGGQRPLFTLSAGLCREIQADMAQLRVANPELSPHELERWTGIGRLVLGETGPALDCLNRAVALGGGAAALADRALVSYIAGAWVDAQSDIQAWIAWSPEDGGAWHLSGLVECARGNLALAAVRLAIAVRLDERPEWLKALATVRRDQGDGHGSVAFLRKALHRAPGDTDLLRDLGLALWAAGKHAEALDGLRDAARPGAGAAAAHFLTGLLLWELRLWEAAAGAFRRCIDGQGTFFARIGLRRVLEAMGDDAAARQVQRRVETLSRRDHARRRLAQDPDLKLEPDRIRYLRPVGFAEFVRIAGAPTEVAVTGTGPGGGEIRVAGPCELVAVLGANGELSAPQLPGAYLAGSRPGADMAGMACRTLSPFQPVQRGRNDHPDCLIDLSGLPVVTVDEPCLLFGGGEQLGGLLRDLLPGLLGIERFGLHKGLPAYVRRLTTVEREMVRLLAPTIPLIPLEERVQGPALVRFTSAFVPERPAIAASAALVRRRVAEGGLDDPGYAVAERFVLLDAEEVHAVRFHDSDAVLAAVAHHGLVGVSLEALTARQIVATFACAAMVVAPADAGTGCAPFCQPGTPFVGIVPAGWHRIAANSEDQGPIAAAGLRHRTIRGLINRRSPDRSSGVQVHVPLPELDSALRVLGGRCTRRGDRGRP